MREDIHNFIVDINKLKAHRRQKHLIIPSSFDRYSYQVAAQHWKVSPPQLKNSLPLIIFPSFEFNRLLFWTEFCKTTGYKNLCSIYQSNKTDAGILDKQIFDLVDRIGHQMAVAITNSEQMPFLYHKCDRGISFHQHYSLH